MAKYWECNPTQTRLYVIWRLPVGYGCCGAACLILSRSAVHTEFSALPPLISTSASLLLVVRKLTVLFRGRTNLRKLRRILCHPSTSATSCDLLLSEEIWGKSYVKMDSVLEAAVVEMRLFIVRGIWQFSVPIPFRILEAFQNYSRIWFHRPLSKFHTSTRVWQGG